MHTSITLSSHVLDTTTGKPVADLPLALTAPDGAVVQATTDADGRCKDWSGTAIKTGVYHLRFNTGDYLQTAHGKGFYPFVDVHFEIDGSQHHYHVPLLLSPFGFSSYRGS